MLSARFTFAAVIGLAIQSGTASAQILRGHLLDGRSGRPISAGALLLLDTAGAAVAQVIAGDSGRFVIQHKAGLYRLRAEALGYQTALSDTVTLEPRRVRYIEFRLRADVVELAPLTIVSAPRVRWLDQAGFYTRRQAGIGSFFTRDDFDLHRPRYASEILRLAAGVRLRPIATGNAIIFTRSEATRLVGGGCRPVVWVDGARSSSTGTIDFVHPDDVEAIEVYRGPSQVPAQYSGAESACGVILVWTRHDLNQGPLESLVQQPSSPPPIGGCVDVTANPRYAHWARRSIIRRPQRWPSRLVQGLVARYVSGRPSRPIRMSVGWATTELTSA